MVAFRARTAHLLFGAVVLCFAVWILSLPVFPTQDGPMHRYYIHVLDAVLHHSPVYSVYRIRHPFPPYATQYVTEFLLSHVVSYDMTEKLFTVLIIVTFAYGLRFCAIGCGPAGDVVSFFAAPLLLHWALMMGFMNYSLAIGLFLFTAGCWQRACSGRPRYWIAFALLVCVLTVTHPVPLLMLIALCLFDLLLRLLLLRRRSLDLKGRDLGLAVGAILFCVAAFQIPAEALQKHAANSVFADMGFHARSTAQFLLLAGVSPFYTVTHSVLANLYRLVLYAVLLGAFAIAAKTLGRHWRERRVGFSDTFFLSCPLLALALPILPDYVNGSGFFATRMVVFLWVGLLVAASGAEHLSLPEQTRLRWTGIAFAAIALLAAQVYFRSVAVQLHLVEQQTMPPNRDGLLLNGPELDDFIHHRYQVAFDPFAWGPALAFVRNNDVILDSPWIDQNIAPLQAVPGSPLMIDDIRMTHLSKTDPGFLPGASLPQSREHGLVQRADLVLYADTPSELDKGIGRQLEPADAARYRCSRQSWYLVCEAR